MSDCYDGPELGEIVKFSVLFGPEGGHVGTPARHGMVFCSPEAAYQYRDGEWVELDAEVESLFASVASIVDPAAIRRGEQP